MTSREGIPAVPPRTAPKGQPTRYSSSRDPIMADIDNPHTVRPSGTEPIDNRCCAVGRQPGRDEMGDKTQKDKSKG